MDEERINRSSSKSLAPEAEFGDEASVSLYVFSTQIDEQAATLANHQQQAASAVMIVFVVAKMLGQMLDPLCEHGHLNLRRASVALMCAELGNNLGSCLHCALDLK